ncbi:uncharacterized protein FOMMEDRAFT_160225 [Fomitiporia mediterranea MF3/22]|uniref:uncharacterized protein n=1 Tax=Fomitiporia mediterranea (strain MF3/22) TaxID=694068 RepID=UPI0004409877|nr:uncharacterized protein FOMMEDRAFT_160225 [Fomitiporia mediterranea MF3/22]EJC99784.1 hypothetical protein FOMMEDRAFT_160225 [Fomitiporia mediterranea MF3/22]
MPNDFFNVSIHSRTSCSVVQATVDKCALATIPTYDHSHGTTLSSTLYELPFPTHSMLNITLYRSTPCAFTFPSAADNTISNGSSGPPLTPLELNLSIRSTSPSLFEPPESTRSTLRISTCMHHSHLLHAVAVQPQPPQPTRPHPTHTHNLTHRSRVTTKRGDEDYIKRPKDVLNQLVHAPDLNLYAPLTLAARCRSAASTSTTHSTSSHTHTQFDSQVPSDDQTW